MLLGIAGAGIEPARSNDRQILSLLRLPVSPTRQARRLRTSLPSSLDMPFDGAQEQ